MKKISFRFNGKIIPVTMLEDELSFTLSFPYYAPLIEEIKESTEARQWQARTKTWKFKKTSRNLFVLDYLSGNNPYSKYDSILSDSVISSVAVNSGLDKLCEDRHIALWYHQRKMLAHILQRKRCIIAGEMRTGKTLPTLLAIMLLNIDGAWWIAPKSAIRGLKLELIKWQFSNKIYLSTYHRFRDIASSIPIVHSDVDDYHVVGLNTTDLSNIPRFIVFDEAQKLKNARTKQGQLSRQVGDTQRYAFKDDCYFVELSGTPAPKAPSDWWNLCEAACPGFLREASTTMLERRLGEWEQREGLHGPYPHLIKWKEDEVELLHHRLGGLVEVFLKKECLDLPAKMYNVIELDIPKDYIRAANMVQKSEANSLQLLNKLRQLSDGFLYTNTPDSETGTDIRSVDYFEGCPKDNQLRNDLDEMEDIGRLIVYCGFQATLDKVVGICINKGWAVLKIDGRSWEVLGDTVSTDKALMEMDGSVKPSDRTIDKLVLVAQADSASTGLELSASPLIIYYSNSYNGAARMQSEDRAHSNNMDKTRGLEIRDYVHLPVDRLVRNNLLEKKTLQSITLGDIENVMKEISHGQN